MEIVEIYRIFKLNVLGVNYYVISYTKGNKYYWYINLVLLHL